MKWSYGITTVPSRMSNEFSKTLVSLKAAGFEKPHLFVDNCEYPDKYDWTNLDITTHWPAVRTAGHWVLSALELYLRTPDADRYAIFQDDFVTYRNLREYLDRIPYPDKGYWNLYTFPSNQGLCPQGYTGWYLSNQQGRGAVALIFSRQALLDLFSEPGFRDRPQDPARGHRVIDGAIVTALKKLGYNEYVHNPSLTYHIGAVSSMGNNPHAQTNSFKGEDFDATQLLSNYVSVSTVNNFWELERNNLERAIRDDKVRLTTTQDPQEIRHFQKLISQYTQKLTQHLRQKP